VRAAARYSRRRFSRDQAHAAVGEHLLDHGGDGCRIMALVGVLAIETEDVKTEPFVRTKQAAASTGLFAPAGLGAVDDLRQTAVGVDLTPGQVDNVGDRTWRPKLLGRNGCQFSRDQRFDPPQPGDTQRHQRKPSRVDHTCQAGPHYQFVAARFNLGRNVAQCAPKQFADPHQVLLSNVQAV
jgi:hypothetical protein